MNAKEARKMADGKACTLASLKKCISDTAANKKYSCLWYGYLSNEALATLTKLDLYIVQLVSDRDGSYYKISW